MKTLKQKIIIFIFCLSLFLNACSVKGPETIDWSESVEETDFGNVKADQLPDACEINLSFSTNYDLNQVVGVTGSQIDSAIAKIRSDSPLIGLGDDIVQTGQDIGINPFYIAAHAAWESSWGTSPLARDKNNLFGYGAFDSCPYECAYSYSSKAESIRQVMQQVKSNYLTEGGKYYNKPNLDGMNKKYATDSNWKNGISSIMNSLLKYACQTK